MIVVTGVTVRLGLKSIFSNRTKLDSSKATLEHLIFPHSWCLSSSVFILKHGSGGYFHLRPREVAQNGLGATK